MASAPRVVLLANGIRTPSVLLPISNHESTVSSHIVRQVQIHELIGSFQVFYIFM